MRYLDRHIVFIMLIFSFAVCFAGAQTLYTIEGTTPTVGQFVGQPVPGGIYPNGPVLQVFNATQAFGPFIIWPFVPPPIGALGDVAVDTDNDRVWATDGITFSCFDAEGVIVDQFMCGVGDILPDPVTGLGCHSVADELWITDGTHAAAIRSPEGGLWLAIEVEEAFPLMDLDGVAQDIELDMLTGTLWIVTSTGRLANYYIDGTPVSGGTHVVTPGPFDLGPNLTGLAIDTTYYDTTGQPKYFFVTDGFKVARIQSDGSAADATFYFPNICETVVPDYGPPAPLSGLGFSLRPVTYGEGGDLVGGPPVPAMKTIGQSCSPSFMFQIGVEDATPFSMAYLAVHIDYLFPPMAINPVCNLYVPMPFLLFLGPYPVLFDGTVTLPITIPAYSWFYPEIGTVLYSQWLISRFGGGIEVSEGLSFTIGLP
jgi:hypothetical protein